MNYNSLLTFAEICKCGLSRYIWPTRKARSDVSCAVLALILLLLNTLVSVFAFMLELA